MNFKTENHNLDTRQRNNLYFPQTNLTIYQKGAYYLGTIIFNYLLLEIKNVAGNERKFEIALEKFLYTYSFYTMEEYLRQLWIMYCITRFLLQWYADLRFCLCALCKYSWIVFKFYLVYVQCLLSRTVLCIQGLLYRILCIYFLSTVPLYRQCFLSIQWYCVCCVPYPE